MKSKKRRRTTINVQLPVDLYQSILAVATLSDATTSDVVRVLLAVEFLRERKAKEAKETGGLIL